MLKEERRMNKSKKPYTRGQSLLYFLSSFILLAIPVYSENENTFTLEKSIERSLQNYELIKAEWLRAEGLRQGAKKARGLEPTQLNAGEVSNSTVKIRAIYSASA